MVKINISDCISLYVGACHYASTDDMETAKILDTSLNQIARNNNKIVMLGGDFNFPGLNLSTESLRPKSPYPSVHQRFVEVRGDNCLTQIINEPTRSGNILNSKITNRPNE